MLFSCLLLALLFSVLFILSLLLGIVAVLVPLLRSSRHSLFGCCSVSNSHHSLFGSGYVSDPLQRHFVVVYSFLDASPAPPTPLLSITPFVIVGSRLVLGLLGRVVYNNVFC